ncbi:hypothetical protein AMTR_s00011p00241790 [Amborella trichopoda]|uniref:Uncharacterized protein n=1 Tax=Amborella trichopoda TaxID=13333 RepID=W1NGV7_AMBTC|nr:hypothetical protein AMTR_s00011p00241790 [Amborella trichopoda]
MKPRKQLEGKRPKDLHPLRREINFLRSQGAKDNPQEKREDSVDMPPLPHGKAKQRRRRACLWGKVLGWWPMHRRVGVGALATKLF